MSITKPPKKQSGPATSAAVNIAELERIVAGAPDASPAERAAASKQPRRLIGKQTAISLALPPDLLEKIDQMASSLSITRAGFIKQALTKAVQAESNS